MSDMFNRKYTGRETVQTQGTTVLQYTLSSANSKMGVDMSKTAKKSPFGDFDDAKAVETSGGDPLFVYARGPRDSLHTKYERNGLMGMPLKSSLAGINAVSDPSFAPEEKEGVVSRDALEPNINWVAVTPFNELTDGMRPEADQRSAYSKGLMTAFQLSQDKEDKQFVPGQLIRAAVPSKDKQFPTVGGETTPRERLVFKSAETWSEMAEDRSKLGKVPGYIRVACEDKSFDDYVTNVLETELTSDDAVDVFDAKGAVKSDYFKRAFKGVKPMCRAFAKAYLPSLFEYVLFLQLSLPQSPNAQPFLNQVPAIQRTMQKHASSGTRVANHMRVAVFYWILYRIRGLDTTTGNKENRFAAAMQHIYHHSIDYESVFHGFIRKNAKAVFLGYNGVGRLVLDKFR